MLDVVRLQKEMLVRTYDWDDDIDIDIDDIDLSDMM